MKYLKQFGIIIAISFIGEILHSIIPLPVPASIYGLVIMFLCLAFKIFPCDEVKESAYFLVEIMPVMFIPAAVELINIWDDMKEDIIPYAVITVVVTFVVMIVAGHVTQYIIKHGKDSDKNE